MNSATATRALGALALLACSSSVSPAAGVADDAGAAGIEANGQASAGASGTVTGGGGGAVTTGGSGAGSGGTPPPVGQGGTGGAAVPAPPDAGARPVDSGAQPPTGEVIDCRGEPSFTDDPEVAQRFEGDNGSFADACTADGNLTKHACEMIPDPACMPVFPNPPPCPLVATGAVIEQEVECAGQCQGGACEGSCPDFGDGLEVLEVDGDEVLVSSPQASRRLRCTLIFDQGGDTFDCGTVSVGATGTITSLGLQATYCTGGPFGNIGACFESDCSVVGQNCSYMCSVEPAG